MALTPVYQTILIRDLWTDSVIGIYPHEATPQPLGIDANIVYDASAAIASDTIADALDYETLSKAFLSRIAVHQYVLLEPLLEDLLAIALTDARVTEASITLHKPNALAAYGAKVSLRAHRRRA